MKRWYRAAAAGMLLLGLFAHLAAAAGDAGEISVHRIPLRVHLGGSGRPESDFREVFAEMNRIWRMQARICFEIEAVDHDRPMTEGLDLWFLSSLDRLNGLYSGPHSIRVRDFPLLAPAQRPASDSAARTAAHELGHALGLEHRQESDDNLMRSKTYGWTLDGGEIEQARRAAALLDGAETGFFDCAPPRGEGKDGERVFSLLP